MKNYKIISIIFLLIFFLSCKEKEKTKEKSVFKKVKNIEPKVDLKEIESDYIKWWTYHTNNISLSSNFIGLNKQSDTIDKKEFLEELITGNYIALKIKSPKKAETYKLFKLESTANKSIRNTIKQESRRDFKHFKMEDLQLPNFEFTDLNENTYTTENTKGKTLILKTWFINCKACVAEFPELNKLVENHKNNNDVIFVSLALDKKKELQKFLLKKDFKYQVIPNQREFIDKKLNLQIYPSHIIVDKNGTILKVVNNASEMIAFLKNETIEKKLSNKNPVPPPPM